jgi:hypothetical protein
LDEQNCFTTKVQDNFRSWLISALLETATSHPVPLRDSQKLMELSPKSSGVYISGPHVQASKYLQNSTMPFAQFWDLISQVLYSANT